MGNKRIGTEQAMIELWDERDRLREENDRLREENERLRDECTRWQQSYTRVLGFLEQPRSEEE